MGDPCYDSRSGEFKCKYCAFSREDSIKCAHPAVWDIDAPASEIKFKSRADILTPEEAASIEHHFGADQ